VGHWHPLAQEYAWAMAAQFEHALLLDGVRGLLRFADNPLGRLEDVRRQYGTRVFYEQRGIPFVIVMDPEGIEELLVEGAGSLNKDRFTSELGRVLGRGLVTSEGDLWRRQRKLMAPSFQPKHIEKLADVMVECTETLLAGYQSGQARDVHADMMRLTLDIVVSTLFGSTPIRSEEVDEHLSAIMSDFHALMFTWRAMFPIWTPFPTRLRLKRSRDRLQHIVREIIRNKRNSEASSVDLLSRLIAAQDETGRGMSDAQLLDEALTVFLAGHETTALALTFALCCLARHPLALTRLEKEVDDVLGDEPASLASVERLEFCGAVVKEAMRLYPPVWAIGRSAIEPISIGGKEFAEGTQFMLPQWVVHRDPAWFAEPLHFLPERWLSQAGQNIPRFAYFPFGGGPRICIGNHFALLEATLALASIVRRVRLSLPATFEFDLVPTITLRPRGPIQMYVEARAHGSRGRAAPGARAESF